MRIYNIAKEFNALPFPGGVVDQPHDAIVRLEVIIKAMRDIEQAEINRQKAKDNMRNKFSGN